MNITLPLSLQDKKKLTAGQKAYLSGKVYTARDAAHKKIVKAIENDEKLPFNLKNSTIFYVGPTPTRKDSSIGAAGPTTSSRMDLYTEELLKCGLSAVIGKGPRESKINKSLVEHQAIYFVGIGGAGALLAKSIKKTKLIAFPELGPEAIYLMEIENMPLYVGLDLRGRDIYRN